MNIDNNKFDVHVQFSSCINNTLTFEFQFIKLTKSHFIFVLAEMVGREHYTLSFESNYRR